MRALSRRPLVRLQWVVLAAVVVTGLGRVLTYVPPPPPPTATELWQALLVARAARADLTFDLAVAGRRALRVMATGVVETAADRSSLRVVSTGLGSGDTAYDEVAVGAQVYVRPADGRWYTYVSAVESLQRPDGLFLLLSAAGELRRAGAERVRGEPTTRYTTSLRGGALDVWVGRDRLPRRLTFQQGSSVATVELYDFLVADPVVVPPRATRVADLADALRRGAA